MVTFAVMLMSVVGIDLSYVEELEVSTRERLRLNVFNILSMAQTNGNQIHIPAILQNPQFNTDESGLWATVLDEDKQVVWQTLSIDNVPTKLPLSDQTGQWYFANAQSDSKSYSTLSYKITWQESKLASSFYFVVAEDHQFSQQTVNTFRLWLLGGFLTITGILLLSQFLVLRYAFRPILILENEIALLEQGEKSSLNEHYPDELKGVTENLNALIDKERRQRERYRSTMADLAHSLKTPIAIIKGEIGELSENSTLNHALTRMDNSIEYQLRRAVISGHNLLHSGTGILNVLTLVLNALRKIHRLKNIQVDYTVDENLKFYGDENDLMELFGNLLDNAFKYARANIRVVVLTSDQQLQIIIEDDGDGFDDKAALKIFDRGERLDSKGLGQGIGLAVVVDVVNSYEGNIVSGASELGGAYFKLCFPI